MVGAEAPSKILELVAPLPMSQLLIDNKNIAL